MHQHQQPPLSAGAAKEVSAAQARLADKERMHYDAHQVADQQDPDASSWREAAQAARQLAEALKAAESAQAAQQQVEQSLRVTQVEVARLKVCFTHHAASATGLSAMDNKTLISPATTACSHSNDQTMHDTWTPNLQYVAQCNLLVCVHSLHMLWLQAMLEGNNKAHKRAQQAAIQQAEHAQHELGVTKRECERFAGDAEDRRVQLSVLVETVETLQAGTVGKLHVSKVKLLVNLNRLHGQCVGSARFGQTRQQQENPHLFYACVSCISSARQMLYGAYKACFTQRLFGGVLLHSRYCKKLLPLRHRDGLCCRRERAAHCVLDRAADNSVHEASCR